MMSGWISYFLENVFTNIIYFPTYLADALPSPQKLGSFSHLSNHSRHLPLLPTLIFFPPWLWCIRVLSGRLQGFRVLVFSFRFQHDALGYSTSSSLGDYCGSYSR